MGKQGVFYEIGAGHAVSRYLLDNDWREASKGFRNAVRLEDFPDIDAWKGYFVECDPHTTAFTLPMLDGYGNYEWVQVAIGRENRMQSFENTKFEFAPGNAWETTVRADDSNIQYWNPVETRYQFKTFQITLDMLFSSMEAPPDFLSIDIEGAEFDALTDYSWEWKPKVIQIDYHGSHLDFYTGMLESHGYEIVDTVWPSFWQDELDAKGLNEWELYAVRK